MSHPDQPSPDEYVIAPASESDSRAAALLPTEPSEDVSHLLGAIDLPSPKPEESERDYLPELAVDWVITAQFAGRPKLAPSHVNALFDRNWRERFGGLTLYGRDAADGRWTYLISSDGPSAVTELKLAWDYASPLEEDEAATTAAQFAARLKEVERRLAAFGKVQVSASQSPEEAAARSETLKEVQREWNYPAVLVLEAPRGQKFSGKQIWDVMLCLGLRWGDMDCFHWRNPSEVGDDHWFSVETSTPPGYFLPEEIAANRVHTTDLVFSLSVPRCAAPVEVFEAMIEAAQYARRRLGGTICDGDGNPADLDALCSDIQKIESYLGEIGIPCGSGTALRLF
ncbi:MAG TPA: cell division protein ZipA C-terminal FtsZ-binding domain-containing protein [Pirellulaceae bacterium]|nr:cell division protein ZipA C-terminal FtsZ-binding domain-containing protein [Pirellulaceae bacterium]